MTSVTFDHAKSEREKVVLEIEKANKERFKVLSNLNRPDHYIGGIFPDLIFLDPETAKPVFIIEVKKNGEVANAMHLWKTMPYIPATIYFIVPSDELQTAKNLGQLIGLKSKYGTYFIDEFDNITINYDSE